MTTWMNARRSTTAAALGLVALATLAGCVKVDAVLTIHDDAVDGTMIMAVERRFAASVGQSEDALTTRLSEGAPTGAGVTRDSYEDGTYVGTRFVLTDVPITELDPGPGGITLRHDKGAETYTLRGVVDLSALDPAGIATAEISRSLDIRISITFPGTVTRHNGDLNGTTVTWRAQPGQKLVVDAVAEDSAPFPWVVVLALGIPVLLIVVGLFAWLFRRRRAPVEPVTAVPAGGVPTTELPV